MSWSLSGAGTMQVFVVTAKGLVAAPKLGLSRDLSLWHQKPNQSEEGHQLSLPALGLAAGLGAGLTQRQKRQRRIQRRVGRFEEKDLLPKSHQGVLGLTELGKSSFAKALQVNLDPTIYGSFAEIGAGQEVSRTFLTAGAAAGTVARSLSAYDMELSDVTYGKAKRYVTEERLTQMLNTEYDTVENNIRKKKGPDTRFFAFATTLAAKAFMSNRECEGWVGLTFQHEAGAAPSTVKLHIRMNPEYSAQQQGHDIGILGTNLIYLCNFKADPLVMVSFLLDGIKVGGLEVDYVNLRGPAYPDEEVDYRLLAMKMVQFRVAQSVLLDHDEASGWYRHVVPNTSLYKKPIAMQRSRFRPVTHTHREVLDAAAKQLQSELGDEKTVMKILDFQIDDIVRPSKLVGTEGRLGRAKVLAEADEDADGSLTTDELKALLRQGGRLAEEELSRLVEEFDVDNAGSIVIDALLGLSTNAPVVTEFLERFRMLESLRYPVLVSGVGSDCALASYLARYTKEPIALVVGGGNYSIGRGLFNPKSYSDYHGGIMEAFGRLFAGNVRIFQYPNIGLDGTVSEAASIDGADRHLHSYLTEQRKILSIDAQHMNPDSVKKETNEIYRGQSEDVVKLMREGDRSWEKYVPDEVAAIIKRRTWLSRYMTGENNLSSIAYKLADSLPVESS